MHDLGDGEKLGASEGGTDGGGWAAAGGVIADVEGVAPGEVAGTVGFAGVIARQVSEGVAPVGRILESVNAGMAWTGPEAGCVRREGVVECGGEAPVGGDHEVAAVFGGAQLGVDEHIGDEAARLGPAALAARGIAGEEVQPRGGGAVQAVFKAPGDAHGAEEIAVQEEDALQSGEEEGDGAPTDAVRGLEEGIDDELVAEQQGGEDLPRREAGVGPGGGGVPEKVNDSERQGTDEEEGPERRITGLRPCGELESEGEGPQQQNEKEGCGEDEAAEPGGNEAEVGQPGGLVKEGPVMTELPAQPEQRWDESEQEGEPKAALAEGVAEGRLRGAPHKPGETQGENKGQQGCGSGEKGRANAESKDGPGAITARLGGEEISRQMVEVADDDGKSGGDGEEEAGRCPRDGGEVESGQEVQDDDGPARDGGVEGLAGEAPGENGREESQEGGCEPESELAMTPDDHGEATDPDKQRTVEGEVGAPGVAGVQGEEGLLRRELQRGQQREAPKGHEAQGGKEKRLAAHGGWNRGRLGGPSLVVEFKKLK